LNTKDIGNMDVLHIARVVD